MLSQMLVNRRCDTPHRKPSVIIPTTTIDMFQHVVPQHMQIEANRQDTYMPASESIKIKNNTKLKAYHHKGY